HVEKNSMNIEGLATSRYPVAAWDFTEVFGSDRTERWSVLAQRFWTISFNDETVEIVFGSVRKVAETREAISPKDALVGFLGKTSA
ncbi:MAG: hypothetical protein ACRC6I_13130, partial [Paracoccaceae bacterium]